MKKAKNDIMDMEEKIADTKKNIEDLPGRMDEVGESIEEFSKK